MLSDLVVAQQKFAADFGKLLVWINEQGWRVTIGDVWAHEGHRPQSCHYIRLAADLNLFVDEVYVTGDHPVWHEIGDFWKSLDPMNRWGGDFKSGDFNHVSRKFLEWM